MDEVFRRRVTIEYTRDITEANPDGRGTHTVGKARMRCDVELVINLKNIALHMGARACLSKAGKCRDGEVTVKRVGEPLEVKREMRGG
jgi:hypothetical protein